MPDITLPDSSRGPAYQQSVNYITLDEAETLALATGQHRGMTVAFSDDGTTWVEAWVPAGDATHPAFARATVLRRYAADDIVPTISVLRWDEYVPDESDTDRHARWMKSPTVYLGKCAKVSAYRGGFRDVIGNRYERAELDHVPEVTA